MPKTVKTIVENIKHNEDDVRQQLRFIEANLDKYEYLEDVIRKAQLVVMLLENTREQLDQDFVFIERKIAWEE